MLLKLCKLGHPLLRQPARPITLEELRDARTQQLIDDMIETMRDADGVGIAAPQVHVPVRIACIEAKQNPRYPQAGEIPLLVLVNPELLGGSPETVDGWEGCLSVNDLRGLVPRHKKVVVQYLDRVGRPQRVETDSFLAIILQHELDHLDGMVFLDRVEDRATLTHLREYERFWKPKS